MNALERRLGDENKELRYDYMYCIRILFIRIYHSIYV